MTDPNDPTTVYAAAPDLDQEAQALTRPAPGVAPLAGRELTLRKAAYLDRAALALGGGEYADRLAEVGALELRRYDNALGGRVGHLPPHAREFADGNSRPYVRQEYREWVAGRTVPIAQCSHDDNCPTTECAYGEGYYDRPADRDPAFPVEPTPDYDGASGLDASACTCPAPPGYGSHADDCGVYGDDDPEDYDPSDLPEGAER